MLSWVNLIEEQYQLPAYLAVFFIGLFAMGLFFNLAVPRLLGVDACVSDFDWEAVCTDQQKAHPQFDGARVLVDVGFYGFAVAMYFGPLITGAVTLFSVLKHARKKDLKL